MSFLDRIAECNTYDLAGFRRFEVAGRRVGWIRHGLARRLAKFGHVFELGDERVRLAAGLADFAARSQAMAEVVATLAGDGVVTGVRHEMYPVTGDDDAPPLLEMERAAVPFFGVRAFGVHMNGFVRRADGLHMWIGRRARDKPTYPGMLDNMVAGGQPIGVGLIDNLIKEAAEEAGIPQSLARRAVPVGAITYCLETPEGLKPDVQYCYDLELPADFVPANHDGEIEEFFLWPIAQAAAVVRDSHEFKFNCNLVIIDFLVRHGVIGPEDEDYVAICRGLHR